MKTINIAQGPQNASAVILGCMRMPALSVRDAAGMVRAAADEGINFSITPPAMGTEKRKRASARRFP